MDNNEELRLRDAQWFANELGKLTAEDQNKAFEAKTIDQMRQVYGGDAPRLLRGRESWQVEAGLGNRIEIPSPRTTHVEPAGNQNLGKAGTEGLVSGAGLGVMGSALALDRIRNREYNKFKKERDIFAEDQVKKWKENSDETYAKSEAGARNRAINEFHDKKLSENPEKLTKWAEKHKDPDIQKAIKRKEILEKDNPRRAKKELDEFLEERQIKNPEKIHTDSGTSQNEASARLEDSARIGTQNKKITPESTTENLETLQKNTNQAIEESSHSKIFVPEPRGNIRSATNYNANEKASEAPSVQGVMDEIKEIEKELEYEQKKEEKSGGVAQYPRPQSQPRPQPQGPAESSSFVAASRRPYGGIPQTYKRAQRVRRRYGPGGVSKGVGKKLGKKGAATLGRAALSNPYVLAAIGIGIGIAVAFFILIATILHACEVHKDLGSSLSAGVTNTIEAALLFPLMLIGREVGLCEAPYQVQIPPNPPGVTTEKKGEIKIENGENIPYDILTVTYDPRAPNAITPEEFNSLSLFDIPLYDFAFIDATGNYQRGTAEDGTKYIQWIFDEQTASQSASYEFELTLSPNDSDIRAINVIYVSNTYKPIVYTPETPQEGPLTSSGPGVKACGSRPENDIWYGADCLPTNNTCNGRWSNQMSNTKTNVEWYINNPDYNLTDKAGNGYNFGDPLCSFKAAKVDAVIDSLVEAGLENKARGEFWKDIAYCEGTPNSFGNQKKPMPMGPAGYFQMGIGTPVVFKAWQPDKPNRGDVPWQRQIQNAINFNNERKNLTPSQDFTYWGAARCLCGYDGYKDKGYCQAIIDQNLVRPKEQCNIKCQERGNQGPTL